MARRRAKQGWKQGNTRHRKQVAATADRLDRAIERAERQAARREIAEEEAQLEEGDDPSGIPRQIRSSFAGFPPFAACQSGEGRTPKGS